MYIFQKVLKKTHTNGGHNKGGGWTLDATKHKKGEGVIIVGSEGEFWAEVSKHLLICVNMSWKKLAQAQIRVPQNPPYAPQIFPDPPLV